MVICSAPKSYDLTYYHLQLLLTVTSICQSGTAVIIGSTAWTRRQSVAVPSCNAQCVPGCLYTALQCMRLNVTCNFCPRAMQNFSLYCLCSWFECKTKGKLCSQYTQFEVSGPFCTRVHCHACACKH
eukprot:1160559-Pelagomonas_calceolata.AAC.5